jgi:hypothetical protein
MGASGTVAQKSKRTPEVEKRILTGLSEGIPLAVICREEGMPHPTTWNDWCAADQALNIAHGRARDAGFDALGLQCIEIADDERHDWALSQKGEITNDVAIARARLRVETRLKLLAKWDPRRYGDKLEIDATVKGDIKITIGGDA